MHNCNNDPSAPICRECESKKGNDNDGVIIIEKVVKILKR